jgi:MFS family permease
VTQVVRQLHRTFHSLESRNFRLYLAGLGISAAGSWMQTVASAWLVLRLTHSGWALGLELAFSFLPILLLGPLGGVVADRFDRRRVLFVTQSLFIGLALALGLLTATGAVQLWMIYALSLATGFVTAVDHPTRQSFVPEMVSRTDVTNAVSLNSAVFTGARIVGPAVAAAVIAGFDVAPVFFLNAASYLAVIVSLWLIRPEELRRTGRAGAGERGMLDGFRYVRQTRELRLPLLVMAALFTLSFNFVVLMPLMARFVFHGGAGAYGSMLSLMGLGSFIGALVFANRARSGSRLLLWAGVAVGLVTMLVATAPTLEWELVFLVPLGFVMIAFMIAGNTTLQLTTTSAMRGRVMALYSVVFLGSTPIGAPVAGWMGQHLGARIGLAFGGFVALAACAVGFVALHRARVASRTAEDRETAVATVVLARAEEQAPAPADVEERELTA